MALLAKITSWLSQPPAKLRARKLYIALVQQSRNPFFYRDCVCVPDTLDGRFEIIVLHLFLARQALALGDEVWQQLLEVFFEDMDRSLREMGVGDMGVGRRIRAMAEAAFGRIKAYEDAAGSAQRLQDALRRNVYGSKAQEDVLRRLTDYSRAPLPPEMRSL